MSSAVVTHLKLGDASQTMSKLRRTCCSVCRRRHSLSAIASVSFAVFSVSFLLLHMYRANPPRGDFRNSAPLTRRAVTTGWTVVANANVLPISHDVISDGETKRKPEKASVSLSDGAKRTGDELERPDAMAGVHDETEQTWIEKTQRELSILMQKRIRYLQNPADCTSAKKLLCYFLSNKCGFACLMHQVVFCFIMAYATERTLVMDSAGWRYSSEGWETAFLPVSNCTIVRRNFSSKCPATVLLKGMSPYIRT